MTAIPLVAEVLPLTDCYDKYIYETMAIVASMKTKYNMSEKLYGLVAHETNRYPNPNYN